MSLRAKLSYFFIIITLQSEFILTQMYFKLLVCTVHWLVWNHLHIVAAAFHEDINISKMPSQSGCIEYLVLFNGWNTSALLFVSPACLIYSKPSERLHLTENPDILMKKDSLNANYFFTFWAVTGQTHSNSKCPDCCNQLISLYISYQNKHKLTETPKSVLSFVFFISFEIHQDAASFLVLVLHSLMLVQSPNPAFSSLPRVCSCSQMIYMKPITNTTVYMTWWLWISGAAGIIYALLCFIPFLSFHTLPPSLWFMTLIFPLIGS